MFYYVYVLRSKKDDKFYFGKTTNLKERFETHQKGKVPSTKNRLPLELIYYEACRSSKDSSRREMYFKTYHGKSFINKRLKSYLTG